MSSQIDSPSLPKPKFGLGIVCYENCDFLFSICAELRTICDCILVGWQTVSYSGKELSQELRQKMVDELNFLGSCGLVDEVIVISNKFGGETTEESIFNEKLKRNTMYCNICDKGMDYCLIVDSDEFHFIEDVEAAIEFMHENGYVASYNYDHYFIKDTHHEMVKDRRPMINFIQSCKNKCAAFIEDYETDECISNDINIADFTRTFHDNSNVIVFDKGLPTYHFALIRDDIEEKISNYSQPKLMSDEKSAAMLRKPLEELLKLDEIDMFGVKHKLRKCSYPLLDEKLERLKRLREECEKMLS